MIYQKNLFTRLTHYAMKLALLLSLRLAFGAIAIALKLKSLAEEDSIQEAALLILLSVVGISVIVWLQQP